MSETEVKEQEEARFKKYFTESNNIGFEEWIKQGEALFGADKKLWRFVCPCCGHVQTIADFIELCDLEVIEGEFDCQVAYYACIGRYDTRIPREEIGTVEDPKKYCNYSSGGVFHLAKTVVFQEGNTEGQRVFDFDSDASLSG